MGVVDPASGPVYFHQVGVKTGDLIPVVTSFQDFRGSGVGEGFSLSNLNRRFPICISLVVKGVGTVRVGA